MRSQRVGHDWATNTFIFTSGYLVLHLYSCSGGHRRRRWHPTSVILPGKSHGWRGLVGCRSMGSLTVRHNWVTSLSLFTFMHWRRKQQPTPVFLPRESQDGGAWWAAVYGVTTELDTTLWGHTELAAAAAVQGTEYWLQYSMPSFLAKDFKLSKIDTKKLT